MSPVFYILLFLGAAFLWLLCSFLYRPVGRLFHRLFKDATDEMMMEDKTENENEKE